MPSPFLDTSALSVISVPFKGTAETLTAVGVSPCSAVQCAFALGHVLWYTGLRPRAMCGF